MFAPRFAVVCLALAAVAGCGREPAARAPEPDAGYFALADRLVARLAVLWDERLQRYDPGTGATTSQINADLLLVHAAAARAGHRGPARQDARARAAARHLTGPQIFRRGRARPGWYAGPDNRSLHPVFQAEVAEGLAAAYRARRALRLDAGTVRRIRAQLARVVTSEAWRWPALLINQFNWNATLLAADATVNGTEGRLARDLRRHISRFAARRGENFGAGLRFRYDPRWPASHVNFDSAEYANIVLGFARSYGQARAAGMARPRQLGLLRDWVKRVVSGYWTHAGYLNWDTGLGFLRWHQRKKVGLAQAALLGIAAEPELQPSPRWGRWAKWLLDRGLREYDALVRRHDRIPAPLAYGVRAVPEPRRMAYLTAARYAANAIRAYEAGLGRARAERPPALYAFDPDTGRLAVTTPAYNTAIVPVNHGAQPYGGLELARLFDAHGEPAANVGGTGRNAFGLHVGALDTQYGARRSGPSPLKLIGAPRGRRVHAGPFRSLRVRGSVAAGGLRATTAYRFTPAAIEARWRVTGRGGRATVTFPSWGRKARVLAVLRDGRRVPLRGTLDLDRVRALEVHSARAGYTVTPRGAGRARLVRTRREASQPYPGPTLRIDLGPAPARFGARIEPAAGNATMRG